MEVTHGNACIAINKDTSPSDYIESRRRLFRNSIKVLKESIVKEDIPRFYEKKKRSYQRTQPHSELDLTEYKCVFCKETKDGSKFSPYLLAKLRENPAKIIQCLDCSSGSVRSHLVCALCSRKLPLNKFSKRQRRTEKAKPRCINCVDNCLEEYVWDSCSSDID